MIKKIELKNFKRFKEKEINLLPNELSLIVGGNNSGKSSVLHALAVWEYCKTVLKYEKSPKSILKGFKGDGYGINIDDFTPINIPSLKYLWTNLNPSSGYNLTIKCYWDIDNNVERFLKIGLALTQERLFIKALESNIEEGESVPQIAYLPPFAGITDKEQWYPLAYRNKVIGQGLAGAVLRNTIIELYNANLKLREDKKGAKSKISSSDLKYIRENDSFEKLNKVLFETFKGVIHPQDFNPEFHTNIKIDFAKGTLVKNRFTKHQNYNKRDIMVEGSGFLQWLSVYTFAINPKIDILLLDEPDAHLHNSLQGQLIEKLGEISKDLKKQILIATHSTDVVKSLHHGIILHVSNSISYLTNEHQKIKVLSGLGTEFFPKLDKLQRFKKVLFIENNSDADLLKKWANSLGLIWPDNIVIWPYPNSHKERKQLFLHLKDEVNNIKCISLSDRDNDLYDNTNSDLQDAIGNLIEGNNHFLCRKWRRWEIENYLICPPAIARLSNYEEEEVRQFLQDDFGLIIHENYLQSDKTAQIAPLFDEGKPIVEGILNKYNISKLDIANEMNQEEIFEDVITILTQIVDLCNN
ncbi:MAG TPA: AAA family ATPase [Flavobacterium sp.]|uniref:ATP-dependent nuclease n=1 Tax=Flavobacterium sp. TaxID=239 RepID=UPI002B5BC20C|nr:AAA family ATPase [Flavobacterium sp.]HSD15582.1 AAA family ATPase [Flavobacterium sp.]